MMRYSCNLPDYNISADFNQSTYYNMCITIDQYFTSQNST